MRQRYIALSLALLSIVFCLAAPAFADGDETLGPTAGLTLAGGSNALSARTDLATGPGSVALDVPAGAIITQALLYWRGTGEPTDADIYVNGFPVSGTLVGQSMTVDGPRTSFRADISALGVLSTGANVLVVSGDALSGANDAVSLIVIVDEGLAPAQFQLRDGSDYAGTGEPAPTDSIAAQDYPIVPDLEDRMAQVMVFGSDTGTNSPRTVDVTVDGNTTSFSIDPLSTGGDTGDPMLLQVEVPPMASLITVQPTTTGDPSDTLQVQAAVVVLSDDTRIGDRVWNDLDADGIQDPGEPGLSGIVVRLFGTPGDPSGVCPDTLVATTTTDTLGRYVFNVPGGSYYVQFVAPSEFSFCPDNRGSNPEIDSNADIVTGLTACTVVRRGEIVATWDAGLVRKSTIGDNVWKDLDFDGIQDPGEPGLEGVTVDLYNPSACGGSLGPVVATTTTDSTGHYRFDVEGEKYYAIGFVAPAGYAFTLPDQGSDNTVDSDADPATGLTMCRYIVYNEEDTDWDAGFIAKSSIGDFVWGDLDCDGIQDSGEPGVSGVTVNLLDCSGNVLDTTTTDANGHYSFMVMSGSYIIEFVSPSGYVFSPKDVGSNNTIDSDPDPATGRTGCDFIKPSETDVDWDAGLCQKASIGDFVWIDQNSNGVQDSGEPGVPGVKVTLKTCTGTVVDMTTTDATGHYLFMAMPGDYMVVFTLPSGYMFTGKNMGGDPALDSDADPITGAAACTTLSPGENDLTWDAGLLPMGSWRTQTQGGWGTKASGNNPGAYRDAHFAACFPSGAMIGKSSGKYALFTTSKSVQNYLPASGTPAALKKNYTNPTSTSSGVLGGQALALTLSVVFDACDPNFGSSSVPLSTLVVADPSSSCYGMTVQQVLDTANLILSGGSSSLTPSQINTCVDKINNNFDNGTVNLGFLKLP